MRNWVKEWFEVEKGDLMGEFAKSVRPSLKCADGFEISIQASSVHYCTPRKDGLPEYASYEVGFPSEDEPLLETYGKRDLDSSCDIYGWVPQEIVNRIIDKHGGIANT